MLEIKRLLGSGDGGRTKISLYRMKGIGAMKPQGWHNICVVGRNGEALLDRVVVEGGMGVGGEIEFIGPRVENVKGVMVSGVMGFGDRWRAIGGADARLVVDEKEVYPLVVDVGDEGDGDVDTEGVVVYRVDGVMKDPVDVKRAIVEGMADYHKLKEKILADSLSYTLGGFLLLALGGRADVGVCFLLGGGVGQIYQLMLFAEVDMIGKDLGAGPYNMFARACVVAGFGALLLQQANGGVSGVADVSDVSQDMLVYIVGGMCGFLTGKLALVVNSGRSGGDK